MKTKERTVHFYDLIMQSRTTAEGVTNPGCADIGDILARITKLKPIGLQLAKKKSEMVEIADWRHDHLNDTYKILLNRADQNVSDVTFKDFSTRATRKGGKTNVEGIEYSSHIIVKPNPDHRSALVLMTMGSGVSAHMVARFFSRFIVLLKGSPANDDLFAFAHPSGQRDRKGNSVTYRVRYQFECVAHKSSILDDALKNGQFVSMELVAHEHSKFDAGGNLLIEAQSISVKASNPLKLSGTWLKKAVKDFLNNKPKHQFDDARIRYKEDSGATRTATFSTNNLDAAFTRKEIIELPIDVESQQTKFSSTIVAAMEKLL